MNDTEIDKASMRSNVIEQRMFELTVSTIDTAKHSIAIDMRRSQNLMKKRLKKYRDRQREIMKSKQDAQVNSIESLMSRSFKKTSCRTSAKPRPKTSPAKLERDKGSNLDKFEDSETESDIEIDGSFYIDYQRSKIDLRPKTAVNILQKNVSLDKYVKIGRLGSPNKEIRYLDEDELKDRELFYQHIVQGRIEEEKNTLSMLNDKVAQFCEKDTIQTMEKKRNQAQMKMYVPPKTPENSDKRPLSTHATQGLANIQSSAVSNVDEISNQRKLPTHSLSAISSKRQRNVKERTLRPVSRISKTKLR
ncbi:hypothetical protein ACJMK2_037001 [Sinanodonta woodiana]|uniref:Uncharacterized protein n=1 Tax=Sinanodonta woodiana TaxID=1069815 RepID=A0ABD3WIX3_SINWO